MEKKIVEIFCPRGTLNKPTVQFGNPEEGFFLNVGKPKK
jgi:hypothetical protein